jgi:fatty-acyl-CoA synthase
VTTSVSAEGAPRTLWELFTRSVELDGSRTALVTRDARWTYTELAAWVDRHARALVAAGVTKGTRVGLWMENDPEWVAVALAATSIGAVLVPVSTFAKADDLEHHLRDADVAHLLMTAGFLGSDYREMLASIAPGIDEAPAREGGPLLVPGLPALRRVVVRGADGQVPAGCVRWQDHVAAGDVVPDAVVAGLRAELDPEDECYLLTTSGTTARPKGVPHDHRTLARNGFLIGELQALVPEDVVWFYFPLFFSAGCINVMLGTLSHGAALIVQHNFDPGEALELIERENATAWHLWLHQLNKLMAHPDWPVRDHSRLHKGTAPFDMFIDGLPEGHPGGVNMYGMTETATAFACTPAHDSIDVRLGSQGHLLPGNEVRIVDPDTGEPLTGGEAGEICVRGASVMRRYYKVDPAETFDAEGFFHTGDLGFVDADGRLHFERRLKDVIKTGGINVSPAEVEAALQGVPGVGAAHVFALPDADRGEVVAAALVVADPDSFDRDTATAWWAEHLPAHKRPHRYLVLTEAEVPMTGSGKVRKHELRDRLLRS